jgi:redox-sensitive bicupin YhaK (pirin superfamily)
MQKIRKVTAEITPKLVMEGAGVMLYRSISPSQENPFDPFLLFDHFAFNDPTQGVNPGFPNHPHRGIETVTYILEGTVRHRDSLGNKGTIGAGTSMDFNFGSLSPPLKKCPNQITKISTAINYQKAYLTDIPQK